MFNLQTAKLEDFTIVEAPKQSERKGIRASYYRTKPGCYTPEPYKVDRIKLSEVL